MIEIINNPTYKVNGKIYEKKEDAVKANRDSVLYTITYGMTKTDLIEKLLKDDAYLRDFAETLWSLIEETDRHGV